MTNRSLAATLEYFVRNILYATGLHVDAIVIAKPSVGEDFVVQGTDNNEWIDSYTVTITLDTKWLNLAHVEHHDLRDALRSAELACHALAVNYYLHKVAMINFKWETKKRND